MTHNSSWSPYTGSGAIILTIVLVIIASALLILGTRMRHSLAAGRPGKAVLALERNRRRGKCLTWNAPGDLRWFHSPKTAIEGII